MLLLDKVRRTIENNGLLSEGDSVICAVSGGADSMCMLYALMELRAEYSLNLYIANVNHLLRGEESDRDSSFVKQFAKNNGIEFFYREYNVAQIAKERRQGEEECGRELRYSFFNEIEKKLGGAKIATAHNLNDNAETILFRLTRGTSPKGLCGIQYKRRNIIRPLLDVSRSEIEEYLKENSYTWCEDSTNSIPVYARNKIRLGVIPLLKEISCKAEEKIISASKLISEDNSFLDEYTLKCEKECFVDNCLLTDKFSVLHIAVKRRVAASLLKKWGVKEVTSDKVENFLSFTNKDNGKIFDIDGKSFLRKTCGKVVLSNMKEKRHLNVVLDFEKDILTDKWKLSMYKTAEKFRKSDNLTAVFDADKVTGPFTVTYRQDGDKISLKGLGGTKKLSDIFTDEKINVQERDYIPVIRKNGNIIYIGGIRQSSLYCPDADTKEYLIIKYEKR